MTEKKVSDVWVPVLLIAVFSILLSNASCNIHERSEFIEQKLLAILPDDLDTIVKSFPKDALLEKPSYKVTSYKTYEKSIYSVKAEVDFYFLKKVDVKIVRKFRYHKSKKLWERYFNEYQYTGSDSADNTIK